MPTNHRGVRYTNFRANITFKPRAAYVPESEQELLEILRKHQGQRFRAVGRLHSRIEITVCEDVLIEVRNLRDVVIHDEGPHLWAEVGAGCQIRVLLEELQKRGLTLPSVGLITEQTIAGAIATGTHGSGRHSLSHYVEGLRIATYDPELSEPEIRVIDSGNELRAARCSLGLLGIVTSVRLPLRRQYMVEEHFRRYERLEEVLAAENEYPLQQFFLVPGSWDFFAQQRREIQRLRSRLASVYRLFWRVGMDIAFHLIVHRLARRSAEGCAPAFYRFVMPALVPRGWKVIDRSDRQLTTRHELFRHIEIEIFVSYSRLAAAVKVAIELMEYAADGRRTVSDDLRQQLETNGLWKSWQEARSPGGDRTARYVHQYPICIRKVLPDDTLISMAAGEEA